jgi:flagellar biogenesis protein FliO
MVAAGWWPSSSFGQAMGKAAVEVPPAAAEAAGGGGVAQLAEKPSLPTLQQSISAAAGASISEGPPAPSALHENEEPRPHSAGIAPRTGGLAMPDLPALSTLSASVKSDTAGAPLIAAADPVQSTPPAAAANEPAAPAPAPAAPRVVAELPPAPAAEPPAPAKVVNEQEHRPIRPQASAAETSEVGATQPAGQKASEAGGGYFKGMGNVLQVGAALAIVLGLVFIGKAVAKKYMPAARIAGSKGVIEVLARHSLAKNQQIVLVRIGSQIVALNQGKDSSESVLVISEPTEVANIIGQIEGQNPKSIQAGFTSLLANARMDLERGEPDDEPELRGMSPERLDEQLEEMAAAKRQLMELRQHVRSVRDSLPRS